MIWQLVEDIAITLRPYLPIEQPAPSPTWPRRVSALTAIDVARDAKEQHDWRTRWNVLDELVDCERTRHTLGRMWWWRCGRAARTDDAQREAQRRTVALWHEPTWGGDATPRASSAFFGIDRGVADETLAGWALRYGEVDAVGDLQPSQMDFSRLGVSTSIAGIAAAIDELQRWTAAALAVPAELLGGGSYGLASGQALAEYVRRGEVIRELQAARLGATRPLVAPVIDDPEGA